MNFNIEPIIDSTAAIKIHLATVLPAFVIGAYLLLVSKKGSPTHRALGWLYLSLMTITAIAALFIRQSDGGVIWGFSFIHLFVPLTLFGVYAAIRGVRTRNIGMHMGAMIGVYIGAILIAGGLTFLPGRIMYRVFFG